MVRKVAVLIALLSTPAAAQIQSRPTEPPLITAVNEAWYQLGEPIQFAGDLYFPAGATVFFDGNTMVRTGHYNGVPLYANTTFEPYSVVLIPIGRGLMQPYERRRRGDVAGTTGSRPPSFPVAVSTTTPDMPEASASPTAPPLPPGAIGAYTADPGVVAMSGLAAAAPMVRSTTPPAAPVGTTGIAARTARTAVASLRPPTSNDGVWITYAGSKWVSVGPAIAVGTTAFAQAGEYAGFPIYQTAERPDVIYIPTNPGWMAPFKRK